MKKNIKHLQLEPGKVLLDGEEFPYMLTKVEVTTGPNQINTLHLEVPFQRLTGNLVKQPRSYRLESSDPDELHKAYLREAKKEQSKESVGHSDEMQECSGCGEAGCGEKAFAPSEVAELLSWFVGVLLPQDEEEGQEGENDA